ncbi:Low-density lipoprotein receptor-related protein 1, partial [Pseudolycoriella hygida]
MCHIIKPIYDTQCKVDQFKCKNNRCIPLRWQCDQESDCGDGSDEDPAMCKKTICSRGEFLCKSYERCIPEHWVCDGSADCDDDSDEINCEHKTCTSEEFACKNNEGECIPLAWMCDQNNDCTDGSDEAACSKLNFNHLTQKRRNLCSGAEDMEFFFHFSYSVYGRIISMVLKKNVSSVESVVRDNLSV